MAFSILYTGTEDGDVAEAMLRAIVGYKVCVALEWNDARYKEPFTASGPLSAVAGGVVILGDEVAGSQVRVALGALLGVTISDETS